MRKIAIAGLMIGLLAAPCLASGGGSAKPKTADDIATSKAKDNAHVATSLKSYIGFDPIYTTIITGDNAAGMLMVGIGIDIPDQKLYDHVKTILPSLRDLYVRSLLYYAAANVRSWRKPDAIAIAEKLQRVTDKYMQRKGVKVLLAQVAIRLNK